MNSVNFFSWLNLNNHISLMDLVKFIDEQKAEIYIYEQDLLVLAIRKQESEYNLMEIQLCQQTLKYILSIIENFIIESMTLKISLSFRKIDGDTEIDYRNENTVYNLLYKVLENAKINEVRLTLEELDQELEILLTLPLIKVLHMTFANKHDIEHLRYFMEFVKKLKNISYIKIHIIYEKIVLPKLDLTNWKISDDSYYIEYINN